jgi:hypothetical protein
MDLYPEQDPDQTVPNTLKYLDYLFTGKLEVHERMIFGSDPYGDLPKRHS